MIKFKVCCPISISLSDPKPTSVEMPQGPSTPTLSEMTSAVVSSTALMDTDIQPPPDVSGHPNLELLPDACGDFESDRILSGEEPGIFDYPWMALLLYKIGIFCLRINRDAVFAMTHLGL